jgi:hypothetical protein
MPFAVFTDRFPVWMLFVFLRQMLILNEIICNVPVFDAVVIGDLLTIEKRTGYMGCSLSF